MISQDHSIVIFLISMQQVLSCVVIQGVSGFSTAGSKFLSIACRARMVSAGDNGVYTGSGLRGVIPYVQRAAAVFLSQDSRGYKLVGRGSSFPSLGWWCLIV
jgi:hypothetical protein